MSEPSTPITTLAFAALSIFASTAVFAGALTLIGLGDVVDYSSGQDIAQFGLAIFFGGLGVIVSIRASSRVWSGGRGGNTKLSIMALIAPLFLLTGASLGVVSGFQIRASHLENNARFSEFLCDQVLSEAASHHKQACLALVDACDKETYEGPCGDIKSAGQAKQCQDVTLKRRAALTDERRGWLASGKDHDTAQTGMCVVEALP